MPIMRILLKIARKVVEGIMQKVLSQVNIVDQILDSTIQGFISSVTGGAWQGDDADAFVDELSQAVANFGRPASSKIKNITNSIQQALDVMDQADSKVANLVDSLADRFASVF